MFCFLFVYIGLLIRGGSQSVNRLAGGGGSQGKGQMVIEMMLISGVGFSVVCGVALSGAVDKDAEELGWYGALLR
jgi:hypothetical protein